MSKPKLMFTMLLSTIVIAGSTLTSPIKANGLTSKQSVKSSVTFLAQGTPARQQPSVRFSSVFVGMVCVGFLVGFGLVGYSKKRRVRRVRPNTKVDRFSEEFLVGPLAEHYKSTLGKENQPMNSDLDASAKNTQENFSISSEDNTILHNIEIPKSVTSNGNTAANPTLELYQGLIEEIITNALKGQIRSGQYIYNKLLDNIIKGTGEIFDRCLHSRLEAIQSELENVKNSGNLFQREDPDLKKARLTRTLKALQSIEGEWERLQKYHEIQAAIKAAIEKIITAEPHKRLLMLLQIIDSNQSQVFSHSQLQQLATDLKSEVDSSNDILLKQEMQQLANGIIRGVESCQQLETHLVRWIYEPTKKSLGLADSQEKLQEPWASWMTQVKSPLLQSVFSTLAASHSVTELIASQPYIDLIDWVELAVVLQSLQGGLVAWFEKQPYDSKWGTASSISTYLNFAVLWSQLSNGFDSATNFDIDKREQLAKASFQILLQNLRIFAHREYFPLYGGVYATFGGDYLRDTLNYLDTPLRQIERTQEKARIFTLLGYSQRIFGNYDQAQFFHQQALEIAREANDQPSEIANLNHLSHICVAQKDYSAAINYSQRALIIARQEGNRLGEAHALATLGYSQVFSALQLEQVEPNLFEQAIEYLKQGLKLSDKLEKDVVSYGFTILYIQALCYNSIGISYIVLENLQTAIEYLEKGIDAAQFSGDRYLQGLNFSYLAQAYYSFNNIEQTISNSCLGMYFLEQIAAEDWRKTAGLLTIIQGQIGDDKYLQIFSKCQGHIIKFIGVDGYDYIPQLLDKYKQSL
jgi:tetratricopeptide (TPR) repeat protein